MSEWRSTSTADLIERGLLEIGDGYRAKNSELSETGLPFARAQNVNGGFRFDGADHFPEDGLGKVGSKVSLPGDCVITTKGSVGRVAYVTELTERFVFSPQLSYWRSLDREALDSRFLRYWLQAPEFLMQCAAVKGSTDMADYVNLRDQRRLRITLPPPDEQRRIGGVLGAIDDLIENNRRRIALLEQMAQAIYREWFVHFRYPGHEHDELVDSPLGPIPARWESPPIGVVVQTFGGGTPSKAVEAYWDGGSITWYTPTDLTRSRAMFIAKSGARITEEGLARSAARMFPARSVLMTSRATIGVVSISVVPGATNQGFIVCVPNERLSAYHLYQWLRDNVATFEALATGATFKEITRGKFREIPILVPAPLVEESFVNTVAPICDSVELLLSAVAHLESLRDLLLPKLVTGQIDVSCLDLDGVLAEEAA